MKTEPNERMSLTETAYKFIFEGILNGRFRAGQSISPDSIAESLKISKTPIREALVQLEVEGLIFRNGRYYNVIFLDFTGSPVTAAEQGSPDDFEFKPDLSRIFRYVPVPAC